ncbi:alpha-L-fucosidase [Asticcacaulis endophyticus]|uniref:alpha-L-fucosidase n=1 Tax=Asticcacaulis endophyticus TaxID=1395890 RepID=A0A918ULY4_9CAUL|nr:alpha-L-fucosidase [Asticcacaulis endophyticus]GGZ21301.1 alpha-L-fucosidase [Asticcacaulis endophyticus]
MFYPSRRQVMLGGAAGASAFGTGAFGNGAFAASGIQPFGAVPSERQAAWHRLETYGFVHFTINTFTDREWGYGDEPASLFNPSDFSADQIVDAAQTGGLNALILTAKHHDGFCLWPSAYTEHSIKNSPYKAGKGDIVRELAEACTRKGLKFGTYLSPWDRNHAEYGRDAYVRYYHNQLEELTTQYGPLFEVWFDGANGGDGYYGGARERRRIDGATYYQWDRVREIVRRNQPQAVMFADAHMDIRWVGNEEGHAGDPCWPTVDATPFTKAKGNSGTRNGDIWNPAETDVSIRRGWFWHADEAPRSAANLLRLYFESVGRGSNLLLNMAPDRRGRVPDEDVRELKAWKALRDQLYAVNLAKGATVTASSHQSSHYKAANLLSDTAYWAAKTEDRSGAWVEVKLPTAQTFDVIRLAEDIGLGVRVDSFAIDIFKAGDWQQVAQHQCIAYKRLVLLPEPVTTDRVRVRFVKADASPVIGQFALFLKPAIIEAPVIRRDRAGMVTLLAANPKALIYFTTDGSIPSVSSPVYTQAVSLVNGGLINAVARLPDGTASEVSSASFDVSSASWSLVKPDATPFSGAKFSGPVDAAYELIIDLSRSYDLLGITLLPGEANPLLSEGPPAGYQIWISADGQNWGAPVAQGEFSNIANSRAVQTVRFKASVNGRFVRLVLPQPVVGSKKVAFKDLGIVTR